MIPGAKQVHVGSSYGVVIGAGVRAQVADALPAGVARVLLLHAPANAVVQGAGVVTDTLRARGLEVVTRELPDAEAAKTAQVLVELWSLLGTHGFTRSDVVIAMGGGATTDLGGFLAASWLRGVPVVQVPTTLLGMVDAAVGGKTGINTPEGKNLVGAFHEPVAVLCDLDFLGSLEQADLVAGLAEVIKCGFIADPEILDLVEGDPAAALQVGGPVLTELVERAVTVKAGVVAADLKESSLREILNYGHTFGHAIEQVEHYSWRHGDAVAVGMLYAAELSRRAGLIDQHLVERHRRVLRSVGLPTGYAGGASWTDLLAAMSRDKKTRGSRLRFVALQGSPGQVTRLEGPDPDLLRAAYDAVRG